MADTYTDKYVINRLRDSYYQKTTTISGFFTTKKTEWDDLYVKGFRYCPSGWLHSNHKEYVEFLNRPFNYEYSSYKNFITKYSKLITILNQFCIYKCHNHAYSRYFSLILVSRDFVTKTKYLFAFIMFIVLYVLARVPYIGGYVTLALVMLANGSALCMIFTKTKNVSNVEEKNNNIAEKE